MRYLFVAALCAAVTAQQKLPSYIKRCDIKSPDFKKCSVQHANEAIPYIVKGDKNLGIPKLDPLRLPLIEVEQSNFKITLTDVKINGLKNIVAKNIDIGHDTFEATFHIENLNIIGTHNINGQVLFLTLKGEGPANITGVGGDYHVKSQLTRVTKNGETFMKFGKPVVDFSLQRAYFNFENLVTGSDQIGSEINNILNENWQDVLKDVGAPIKETVGTIIESIVSNILEKVPENEIF